MPDSDFVEEALPAERSGCGRDHSEDSHPSSSSTSSSLWTELAIPVELGQLLFLDDHVV